MAPAVGIDLYWLPLGAGGHSVRFNGQVFEVIAAASQHRRRCELYHAALVVDLVRGRAPALDLAPVRADRFAGAR